MKNAFSKILSFLCLLIFMVTFSSCEKNEFADIDDPTFSERAFGGDDYNDSDDTDDDSADRGDDITDDEDDEEDGEITDDEDDEEDDGSRRVKDRARTNR